MPATETARPALTPSLYLLRWIPKHGTMADANFETFETEEARDAEELLAVKFGATVLGH